MLLLTGLSMALFGGAARSAESGGVALTTVDGPITPVVEQHLAEVLSRAASEGRHAVVIRLDTPGGGLEPTRDIVQGFLQAPVPVIVHVAPSGADAGSAGTFLTYAAHVAAMAPGTTIGAATPVDLEGQDVAGKVVANTIAFAEALAEFRGRDVGFAVDAVRDGRSVTSATALELGAVDVVVDGVDALLRAVDGLAVEVRGQTVTLDTAGAAVVADEMPPLRRFLQILADPNLAFVFLSLGTLAILYEIGAPGLGLGGVVGATSLILAMFSLSVLPVNVAGLLLMAVAAAMFVAELFMPGIGVGAAGGTSALLVGGLFLFQGQSGLGIDWWVLIPTAVVAFAATAWASVFAARTRHVEPVRGSDDLVGREAVVEHSHGDRAQAQIYGSYWRVRPLDAGTTLCDGQRIRVVRRENIDLLVEPIDEPRAAGA